MKKNGVVRTICAAATLAVSLGFAAVPGWGADKSDNVSSRTSASPLAFGESREWTREEMENAKPLPAKVRSGAPGKNSGVNAAPLAIGTPGAIPAKLPNGVPLTSTDEDAPQTQGAVQPLGYDYPPPYSRFANFDAYTAFPYKTVGKLFFKQDGYSYVCSAASIGNYAIWTAGHCVFDPDTQTWSSNVVFVPAYKNGTAPYGQWVAVTGGLWTKAAWANDADFRYDMGGAILKPKLGVKISRKVGSLGFAWNWSPQQHWFALGYPQAPPFDGKTQQVCTASLATTDANTLDGNGPYPDGMGCDMTGGSSGGPWIMDFGSGNYLNGNVSYGYLDLPEAFFSPYFGDDAKSLYDALVGDTP